VNTCKRKICVWYDEQFENNCLNTSKVCTQPQNDKEYCPAFEIDNYKYKI
jgi:hypothetical protein